MNTAEKIRILQSNTGSSVTLTREGGEILTAHIIKLHGDGEDTTCTFMDIFEGVERVLSVSEIVDIAVG